MSISELQRRVAKLQGPKCAPKPLSTYRDDPVAYAEEHLGLRLTPQQKAICNATASGIRCRVLVPSGNETGKSFIAAVLLSWWYDTRRPGMAVVTAPSQALVVDVVFRELRKLRANDPGFSPKAPRLQDAEDHLILGVTAKDANAFQGRRETETLFIMDEAEGVATPFWQSGETFADRIVCFYNPISQATQASVEERSGNWTTLNLSAIDHPNVVAELRGDKSFIPIGTLTLDKVISRLVKWGSELPDSNFPEPGDVVLGDRRFRPSPMGEARVLGRRPKKSLAGVIDGVQWDRAVAGPFNGTPNPRHKVAIGCDVARFGRNNSVFHVRKGPVSIYHESRNGMKTHEVASRIRQLADEYTNPDLGPSVPCVIDDTGVGGGVVDLAMGYNFIGVNAAARASDPEGYPNIRSELHFDFADLLAAGLVDLSALPHSITDALSRQLGAVEYSILPRGQRCVDSKIEVEKSLDGQSPDDADALLLAYYIPDILRETH